MPTTSGGELRLHQATDPNAPARRAIARATTDVVAQNCHFIEKATESEVLGLSHRWMNPRECDATGMAHVSLVELPVLIHGRLRNSLVAVRLADDPQAVPDLHLRGMAEQ